jgi:hypothetical protein
VSDTECYQPTGYVADNTDCDDTDASQYPGADEYCNGEDDDCDGDIDEDGEVLDGDTWYADSDGDGTGDEDNTLVACSQPSGYVDNTWDCNDADATEPVVVDQAIGSAAGPGTMSSPFDTVQDGIDNADECVIVFSGTYTEAVAMNGTDLLITGVDGMEETFIDATGTGEPAFTVDMGETSATVIDGFTLTGDGHLEVDSNTWGCTSIATCTDWYYTWCGGGFFAERSDPTVRNCNALGSILPVASTTTSGNDTFYTTSMGGGMCFLDSMSTVLYSEVWLNYADQGGGVYIDETSTVRISQTYVVGNEASDGGGVEVDGGSVMLSNVASRFNDALYEGGGLLLLDAVANVVNATFGGDDAPTGGALYAAGSSVLELINSIVTGAVSGAGVLVDAGSTFTGTYNNFYGNTPNYSGVTDPTGTNGNISTSSSFVAYSADGVHTNDDFHLQSSSACVNAGNPAGVYNDADGTRNDMGAYGGAFSDWD